MYCVDTGTNNECRAVGWINIDRTNGSMQRKFASVTMSIIIPTWRPGIETLDLQLQHGPIDALGQSRYSLGAGLSGIDAEVMRTMPVSMPVVENMNSKKVQF
jgi:hypothetical protein